MEFREKAAWSMVVVLFLLLVLPARADIYTSELEPWMNAIIGHLKSAKTAEWQQVYWLRRMAEKCK